DQLGHLLRRAGAVGEEQARPLQPLLADLQAILQVAVVVLIRFRVNDNGVIDAGAVHAGEQVLRRRRLVGAVRGLLVVGEALVVLAGEAVQVGVDDRRPLRLRGGRRTAGQRGGGQGGGLQELAAGGGSSHGRGSGSGTAAW